MVPRRPPSGVPSARVSVPRPRIALTGALAVLATAAAVANRQGAGPSAPAAVAGLAAALLEGLRRVPPPNGAFTVARWSCAAGAGSLTFAALREGFSLAPRNLLALSAAMVAAAVAAGLPLWPAVALGRALGLALDLSLGLLFVAAWEWTPLVTPLFLLPLGLVHWAASVYSAVRADQGRLAGMQRATHALSVAIDPREAMPEFLTEARRCFEAEAVDLVVVQRERRRLWRSRAGIAEVIARIEPAGQQTLAGAVSRLDNAVLVHARAADAELAVLLEREGWRTCLAAPVRLGGGVAGALAVYDPGSHEGFERNDLAVEAGAALEKGELLETILEERTKLSEIVEHASDGIAALDPDGTVTSWNP